MNNEQCKIKKYPTIKMHRGGVTSVNFNLSNFDYKGGYVVLTIKKKSGFSTIYEQIFDKQEVYLVVFDKKFTESLHYSNYLYDLVLVVEGEYYPLCLPSDIVVEEVIASV